MTNLKHSTPDEKEALIFYPNDFGNGIYLAYRRFKPEEKTEEEIIADKYNMMQLSFSFCVYAPIPKDATDIYYKYGQLYFTHNNEKKKIDVSCINMSYGYYNMHTAQEFISIEDVKCAIEAGKNMVKELGFKKYEYQYKPIGYYQFYYIHINSLICISLLNFLVNFQ